MQVILFYLLLDLLLLFSCVYVIKKIFSIYANQKYVMFNQFTFFFFSQFILFQSFSKTQKYLLMFDLLSTPVHFSCHNPTLIYHTCVVSDSPLKVKSPKPVWKTFFQIWDFLLVFLIYRVKHLIIFCPQKTHSNSNHPNPSENFEMSLRGADITQIR